MLAIIRCFKVQRYFLKRVKISFKIQTNHKNLEYFIKTNQRQARQALSLLIFYFTLKHVAGKSMGRVNSLSKRADWIQSIERLFTRNYQWLEVIKKVKQYVEKYNQYQRIKNRAKMLTRKLRLNIMLENYNNILVDLIIKLLVSRDYDSILIVCDRFLKMSYFITTTKKTKELTKLFRNNIWKLHRLLENVILEKYPQFATVLMKELNEILEIDIKLSTTFHL